MTNENLVKKFLWSKKFSDSAETFRNKCLIDLNDFLTVSSKFENFLTDNIFFTKFPFVIKSPIYRQTWKSFTLVFFNYPLHHKWLFSKKEYHFSKLKCKIPAVRWSEVLDKHHMELRQKYAALSSVVLHEHRVYLQFEVTWLLHKNSSEFDQYKNKCVPPAWRVCSLT